MTWPTPSPAPDLDALERALGSASAYASWRGLDPGPGVPVDARYAALPVLTKERVRRDFPRGFVPAGYDLDAALARREVEFVTTAGTTQDTVTLLWHQGWWDASERASWQLNAHARRLMTGAHREAVLASPRCVGPPLLDRPLSREERTLGRLLFLNQHPDVASWSDAEVGRMLDELVDYGPVVLEADPNYLAALCRRARSQGRELFQPELVVLTYSYPSRSHLRTIRRALRAPIMSSHGSTECGYVFVECEHGRLHQNTETCHVDLVPLIAAHGGPRLAQLVVTPFGHPWLCLLRFDIGDLARVSDELCACGNRRGWVLDGLAGRAADATLTTAGRLVSVRELDEAVSSVLGIGDYHLEQGLDAYALRFVPEEADRDVSAQAARALANLYGPQAAVTAVAVSALTPEASGKYRLAHRQEPLSLERFLALTPPSDPSPLSPPGPLSPLSPPGPLTPLSPLSAPE